MKSIYIDLGITQNRCLLLEDGMVKNIYIDNNFEGSLSGNIYKARVEYVDKRLNSAFLDIGIGSRAILNLKRESRNIKMGDDLTVQIKSDSEGAKGPKASLELTFPGKNLILLINSRAVKVSRKISDDVAFKLAKLGEQIIRDDYGILFKSSAGQLSNEEITSEYIEMINLWEEIVNRAQFAKPPYIIYNQREFLGYIFNEIFESDVDEIIVDSDITKQKILKYLCCNKKVLVKKSEIFEKYIDELLKRKHILDPIGNIIVDEVEAFTIFDVNSGDGNDGCSNSDIFLKINKLAAQRIFDLIRLRNMGGIIFIDFIDMNFKGKRQLLDFLEELLLNDNSTNKIYGWTKAGVLELMRAKRGKKLKEIIYNDLNRDIYNECHALKLIEDRCRLDFERYNKSSFKVQVSPNIYKVAQKINFEEKMRTNFFIQIDFIVSDKMSNFKFI